MTPDQTNALLGFSEALSPMLDMVDGHREEMIRRGYSPTAAEAMAVEFHRHMLAQVFSSAKATA